MLKEFHKLCVQWVQVFLFWAQWTACCFFQVIIVILLFFGWMLLLLKPNKLIGKERVLHQQLLVRQILNNWNVLHLAHWKWYATNILVLILNSVCKARLLGNSKLVCKFLSVDVVTLCFIVYFLVYLNYLLIDLPVILKLNPLIRVIKDIRVACQTQVLQCEVTLFMNMSVVVLRNFRANIIFIFIFRFMSFIFILYVDLSL